MAKRNSGKQGGRRTEIRVVDVLELKIQGKSYPEIARILSNRHKRSPPYQPTSIARTLSAFRKGLR